MLPNNAKINIMPKIGNEFNSSRTIQLESGKLVKTMFCERKDFVVKKVDLYNQSLSHEMRRTENKLGLKIVKPDAAFRLVISDSG